METLSEGDYLDGPDMMTRRTFGYTKLVRHPGLRYPPKDSQVQSVRSFKGCSLATSASSATLTEDVLNRPID